MSYSGWSCNTYFSSKTPISVWNIHSFCHHQHAVAVRNRVECFIVNVQKITLNKSTMLLPTNDSTLFQNYIPHSIRVLFFIFYVGHSFHLLTHKLFENYCQYWTFSYDILFHIFHKMKLMEKKEERIYAVELIKWSWNRISITKKREIAFNLSTSQRIIITLSSRKYSRNYMLEWQHLATSTAMFT